MTSTNVINFPLRPILRLGDRALDRERDRIEGQHCTRPTTGERVYVSEVYRDGGALVARCWRDGACVEVQSFRLKPQSFRPKPR